MFCSLFQRAQPFNWTTPKDDPEASLDIDLPDGKDIIVSIDHVDGTTFTLNFTIDLIDWEDSIDDVDQRFIQPLIATIVSAVSEWKTEVPGSTLLYIVLQKPVTDYQSKFSYYLARRIAKVTAGSFSTTESPSILTLRVNW